MDSTTPDTGPSATSSFPAARLSARPPATSLAGLIDVLDRVDGPAGTPGRRRPAAHRSAASPAGHRSAAPGTSARPAGGRPNGFRATATRSVPLRSVQPAPMARRPAAPPAVEPGSYWDMTRPPAAAAPIEAAARRTESRRAALVRRSAMWGAGPAGENLTWRTSMAPSPLRPSVVAAPREPLATAPREPRLRGLVRRMALWGAGNNGENLAWRVHRAPATAPGRRLDPPVVLREMPSTPMIAPAATSPAAALVPAGAAPTVRRSIGPVLPRVAPLGWAAPADPGSPPPSGRPAPPTGWPQPPAWPPAKQPAAVAPAPRAASSSPVFRARKSPVPSPRERRLARARGDPLPPSSRGSPPLLPAPRPAHAAPG
jgi:hypothetical protein